MKLLGAFLAGSLFLVACNKNEHNINKQKNQTIQGVTTNAVPSKLVDITVGPFGSGCALDDQGHANCWFPDTAGYPKKTNADLVKYKYLAIGGGNADICAITDSHKILCFKPDDASVLPSASLNTRGKFKNVATILDYFCAIDMTGALGCHKLDFTGSVAQNSYVATEEVIELDLGSFRNGTASDPFVCWIGVSNTLRCAPLDDNPAGQVVGKVEAIKFAAPSYLASKALLVGLAADKKTISYFGLNKYIPVPKVTKLDLSGIFDDFAVFRFSWCGILASSQELKCQEENTLDLPPGLSNDDLQQHRFTKLSIGDSRYAGLREDKNLVQWSQKDYPVGLPKHLSAE